MQIDLNSDLGEHYGAWQLGDDQEILKIVTSANIACGFHAGDPSSIRNTVAIATQASVSVGAHVGYPDLVGFGRRNMEIASSDLQADVIYQLGALQALAKVNATKVTYVKPHGALYNTIAKGGYQAEAVITAIKTVDPSLPLLCLAGSPIVEMAIESGLRVVQEAFADRSYLADGNLAPRSNPKAILSDPHLIAERMVSLVTSGTIETVYGTNLSVRADSICVHGDSPNAIMIARAVREALENAGVSISSFSSVSA